MLSRRTLFCGLLLVATSVSMPGQESRRPYEALQQALGLSDAQISQLEQIRSAPSASSGPSANQPAPAARHPMAGSPAAVDRPTQGGSSPQDRLLYDSQRSKLAEIAKVLDRSDAADLTIGLGLINQRRWPGDTLCFPGAIRVYASYPYAAELGLTPSQVTRFEEIQRDASAPLWAQVREKVMQREELLHSGATADAPAVAQLGSDMNKLQAQINARPRQDLARAVLDGTQRAKLAAFETVLQLAHEAIELGLIRPRVGDPLCP
jgi:hypothetical protein